MTIVPVYNILLTPDANIYLKTAMYQELSGRVPFQGEKVTLIVKREDIPREQLTADSFYPIGLSGAITEISTEGYLVIHTAGRVNLDDIAILPDRRIDLYVSRRAELDDLDPEDAARRLEAVKEAMRDFAVNHMGWGDMAKAYIDSWHSLGEVAAVMSPWMTAGNEERYAVLAEDSTAKRADMLEKLIFENLEMSKLSREASTAREEDYQKVYRESAIRKQLEYLQNGECLRPATAGAEDRRVRHE